MSYAFTKFGMVVRSSDDATIPIDPSNSDYQAVLAWVAEGNVVTPYVEPFDIESAVIQAVQQRLDAFFQTRGYDNADSAAKYVTSKNPKYAAEGQYSVDACTDCWDVCYAILADVQAGRRSVPTLEEVMAELPPLAWPV